MALSACLTSAYVDGLPVPYHQMCCREAIVAFVFKVVSRSTGHLDLALLRTLPRCPLTPLVGGVESFLTPHWKADSEAVGLSVLYRLLT